MSIVLIGYRGSGKSSVGRALADRLSKKYFDSDELVVRRAGKNIKEIFETDGEERFRKIESDVVRELSLMPDAVISLGGGAILLEENRDALRGGGHKIFYLKCDAEKLLARIQGDPHTAALRPNLTHLGGGLEEIKSLLAVRELLYHQTATSELDVTDLTIEQAAEAIIKSL